jgi:hypothetical protein
MVTQVGVTETLFCSSDFSTILYEFYKSLD